MAANVSTCVAFQWRGRHAMVQWRFAPAGQMQSLLGRAAGRRRRRALDLVLYCSTTAGFAMAHHGLSLCLWLASILTIISIKCKVIGAFSTPSPSASLPPIKAAVIVPGFLTGRAEFQPLADTLTARGIPSVVIPMPNWHWIPCIGGRSMRPVLERIDVAVRHLAASDGDISTVPDVGYSVVDCWNDFWTNPGGVAEVGGSADPDQYPIVEPRGTFPIAGDPKGRVALIGHSAGGWISRVYLSKRNYGGKVYGGSDLIHSVVTLGSPLGNAPGAAFAGVGWCNKEALPDGVRGLAVAGKGFPGDSSGQFTQNCYAFCCNDGTDGTGYDGDGVTPVHSSLYFEGAEKMIVDDCAHFAWTDVFGGSLIAPDLTKKYREKGGYWYGSDDKIDEWASWLLDI